MYRRSNIDKPDAECKRESFRGFKLSRRFDDEPACRSELPAGLRHAPRFDSARETKSIIVS
jgi:hypothetical protein